MSTESPQLSSPNGAAPVALSVFAARRNRLARLQHRFTDTATGGHAIVAQTLFSLGHRHVFGVTGTPVHETLAACSRLGVRPIGMHHQCAAALAAIAHAYVSGKLEASIIVSAGPAVTNLLTGVLFARDNCLPALVLGGRRDPDPELSGLFQELDAVPVFSPVAKQASTVCAASDLAPSLAHAHALALSGRPGPVYLDLCEGALHGRAEVSTAGRAPVAPPAQPEPHDLERAADLLLRAERPLAILGKGLRWNDAFDHLRQLVEALEIPLIASPMGRGLMPESHRLDFTAVARSAQAAADVVLVAGARMNWQFRFGTELAPDARIIAIDVHPPELAGNVSPEVGLVGDASVTLSQLVAMASGQPHRDRASWIRCLDVERQATRLAATRRAGSSGAVLTHERLMWDLGRMLPRDSICVLDGNVSMQAAQEYLPLGHPVSRLNAGSNGTVGVGLPMAIGAKLAQPDRSVVAVCGDFAFGVSCVEIETAVRHRVPLVVVVIDNGGTNAGTVQRSLYRDSDDLVAGLSDRLRHDRLAEALGAHGEFVASPDQLQPAFTRALESGLPAVIHARVGSSNHD